MAKKIISLILVICLVLSLSINAFCSSYPINGSSALADQALASKLQLVNGSGLPSLGRYVGMSLTSYLTFLVVNKTLSSFSEQAPYNFGFSEVSITSGTDLMFRKGDFTLTLFDTVSSQSGESLYFYPSNFSSSLAETLGDTGSGILCDKISQNTYCYYLHFANTVSLGSAYSYRLCSGVYLSYENGNLSTTFAILDPVNFSVYAVPLSTTPISVIFDEYLNSLTDTQQSTETTAQILSEISSSLDTIIKYLKDSSNDVSSSTSSISGLKGNWLTKAQGALMISGIDSAVSYLSNISTSSTTLSLASSQVIGQLSTISGYDASIVNALNTLIQAQNNFFFQTSQQLATLQNKVSESLTLSPGNLFGLGDISVGFIRGLLNAILMLLIGIFGFLGMFQSYATGVLGFLPTGLVSIIVLIPFVGMTFSVIKFIRG